MEGVYPTEIQESATLTLLESKGVLLGITCKHVVDRAKETGVELATVRGGIQRLPLESFWHPSPKLPWLGMTPDIAIIQLDPWFPERVGKIALRLTPGISLAKATHGVAVGYPEKIKSRISDAGGYYVASPCVHLLAENSATSEAETFVLFSELPEAPVVTELSGLSGGPVFWTSADSYGLLGIVRSAQKVIPPTEQDSFGGGPRLAIRAERVTSERVDSWVEGSSKTAKG
jgi:hypothetical protein